MISRDRLNNNNVVLSQSEYYMAKPQRHTVVWRVRGRGRRTWFGHGAVAARETAFLGTRRVVLLKIFVERRGVAVAEEAVITADGLAAVAAGAADRAFVAVPGLIFIREIPTRASTLRDVSGLHVAHLLDTKLRRVQGAGGRVWGAQRALARPFLRGVLAHRASIAVVRAEGILMRARFALPAHTLRVVAVVVVLREPASLSGRSHRWRAARNMILLLCCV